MGQWEARCVIMGDKVWLGPVMDQEKTALLQWLNDPELAAFSGAFRAMDEAAFADWLSGARSPLPRVLFVIRSSATSAPLGYVEIYHIDANARSAEFGILIADPANRGQGFGGEATRLALAFCWDHLDLQRVALRVVGDNPAATHMYAKAGFQPEGVLRRAAHINGRFLDVAVMAILRDLPTP